VLLDVAMNQAKGPVILRDIAKRQAISEKYLWQVINPLKGAGLVNSARGARGGYTLARKPETISVLDVVTILEGPVSVVECVEASESCNRSSICVTRGVWGEIEARLREVMAKITLRELMQRQRDFELGGSVNYVI